MKPTQLGPLEGANLNDWTSKIKSVKMKLNLLSWVLRRN
jgi:hypothetical protein